MAGTEEDQIRIARFVAAGHVDGVLLISTHFGQRSWPRLSSEMVRLLLARIAGEPPSGVILPTELVQRGSA